MNINNRILISIITKIIRIRKKYNQIKYIFQIKEECQSNEKKKSNRYIEKYLKLKIVFLKYKLRNTFFKKVFCI